MAVKEIATGTIITLVIGGSAYTISQTDVIENFADDTGLTQQQAEEYVKNIDEDELVPYADLGSDFVKEGNEILAEVAQIDCDNYEYEWESPTLSCVTGRNQLAELGNDEVALGQAYIKLDSDSASKTDISETVRLIDEVNSDYGFEIVRKILDFASIDEAKKTNSYNKATLEAALESNN
jgi:hypothetical protein